jgi:hypothetical protein
LPDKIAQVPASVTEKLPAPNHYVVAICEKFRCKGYVDAKGIWRHGSDNKEIGQPVIAWAEFG